MPVVEAGGWGLCLGHALMVEARRGWSQLLPSPPDPVLLPEYGPVGLLLLLPIDDTGEEAEGLCT